MRALFEGCTSLKSLDASDWDTSHVEDMSFMFNTCSSLEELDVSGWDTSSVTDMNALFMQCRSLKQLDVSHWDTSKVKSDKPSAHDTEGASEFNAGMNLMFENCSSLRSLDLSSWDTTGVTQATHMFDNCGSLESVTVGEKYAINSADMVPEPLTTSGWWSTRDGKWISKADVVSGRSGVADLYLGYAATFSDVTGSTAHVGDIAWLAFKGISKGWEMSDGTVEFRPYANVARADMAAFLFRLAKQWGVLGASDDWAPKKATRAKFTDVGDKTSHAQAIWWMAENGISAGWDVGGGKAEFRPNADVKRGDLAAFLGGVNPRDPEGKLATDLGAGECPL
jgi:surface protein